MILLNEFDQPTPITTIEDARQLKHFWMYDFQQADFMLTPLTTIVELASSSLSIESCGNSIHLPVDWYAIVCDKMTGSLDTIAVHELTNTNFRLLTTGPSIRTVTEVGYRVVDFAQSRTFFHPSVAKHQLLCVAVSPSYWIMVTPHDSYQRYLKHTHTGDFFM